MDDHKINDIQMTFNEIKEKILKGGEIALQRLIERKRREDSYLVVSENGKPVKLWARDVEPKTNTTSNK